MSTELSVLLVLLAVGKPGSSVRPVVTFKPNWDKIFTTESLTMTCNVSSPIPADMSYIWWKDNNRIHTGQSFVIPNAGIYDSGSYKCKGTNTDISDPARLEVSHGWVILQAPLYVYEGDFVTLRCRYYPGFSGGWTTFYKDNTVIRTQGSDSEFNIPNINLERSGKYTCKKDNGQYLGEASISVKELFTDPKIEVTPNQVLEGDPMTLTCDTSLNPYRQTTLQFAFYRDQLTVQNFTLSNQYEVQQAPLEDSGKYYCEAKTLNSNVKKKSNELNVKINKLFTDLEIKASPNPIEGDNITMTCLARHSQLVSATEVQYAFHRNGQNVQEFGSSNKYGILFAKLEDSGYYICEVRRSANGLTEKSEEINVQIQEFFAELEIKASPNPIEGDNITMTCLARHSQLVSATEVQYAFHRNGQNVQEFGSSNKYEILFAKLEDSGYYICEVRRSANGLTQKSKEINVQIQGEKKTDYTIQNIIRLLASWIIILIGVFIFYCHMKTVSVSKTRNVEDAEERVEEHQLSPI